MKIRWKDITTNREVATLTGIDCFIAEIKQRRWRLLQNVMRMDDKRHPKIALTWTLTKEYMEKNICERLMPPTRGNYDHEHLGVKWQIVLQLMITSCSLGVFI